MSYDEFSLFHENAAEFGLPFDRPPVVRRDFVEVAPGRRLSALVWGEAPPEVVLLHGGAQNAHTWDTVALALNRPLLAIDLVGHGHSDPASDAVGLALHNNAADVAEVIRQLAPQALAVVGMSLGGLTTLVIADIAPELVRKIVLVDVTPGVNSTKAAAISAFVQGPAGFENFDELLARTIEHNPTRTVASLRRGVLHNALQLEDGTWVWRYARGRGLIATSNSSSNDGNIEAEAGADRPPEVDFASLWDIVSTVTVPLMLARGMRPQSVVDDADETELLRRCPHARIEHFAEAGHSLQGDMPVEFAAVLDDFLNS